MDYNESFHLMTRKFLNVQLTYTVLSVEDMHFSWLVCSIPRIGFWVLGRPLRHMPHCNHIHQLLYGSLKVKGELLYSVVLRWSVGVDAQILLLVFIWFVIMKYSSGLANRCIKRTQRGQRVTLPVYAL